MILITVLLVLGIIFRVVLMAHERVAQREVFFNSVVAGIYNFVPASLYEITDPGEREIPKVSFV